MRWLPPALIAGLLLTGAGYIVHAADSEPPTGMLDPAAHGSLLYVDQSGHRVGQVPADRADGPATYGELSCLRVYSAGGTTVCLRAVAVPPSFEAAVFGPGLEPLRTINLDGTPSRARVSPSGKLVGWTVFRSGDSYLPAGSFSTTAGILDLRTGTLYGSMEDFTVLVDGRPYEATDRNFWGVTFAPDDRTFYLTMASAGRTWLLRGDLSTRRLVSVRENAECPSVSPDGGRVVYKKKSPAGHWRLHVLDLRTGVETPLGDPEHLDDQAVWLDDRTIGYSRPPQRGEPPAIYAVPADGTGSARLLRRDAASVVPVR